MPPALQTHHLVRRFKRTLAVDHVSISVPRGAIYGFLGANGAGKTTTLRLVLGLLRAHGGSIELFGAPAAHGPRIGSLIETPSAYDHLTGRENLALSARILGLGSTEIDRVLEVVDLSPAAARRAVGGYSLGMRQRLGIARALLGSPPILILDEPTNGLDPDGIRDMRVLLKRLADSDVTLIVSSHLLGEVEQIATHVGLLHRGRLLVEGALDDLLGGDHAVELGAGRLDRAAAILAARGLTVETRGGRLLVRGAGAAVLAELLVQAGEPPSHLSRHRPTLEQLYAHHVALAA